jgi:hypothetical protein
MTTRVAAGTISRNSSSRFAVTHLEKIYPVRLPPGGARLATRPSLTGSSPILNTMGNRLGCRLGLQRRGRTNDDRNSPANQFGGERRQPLRLVLGPAGIRSQRSHPPPNPATIRNCNAALPCNTKNAPWSFPCNTKNAPCSLRSGELLPRY